MRLLLDTNAYTALATGDEGTAGLVRNAEELLMSVIVLGELRYGFRYGTQLEKNERMLTDFLSRHFVRCVTVTEVTADRYGRIASGLRKRGRLIPQNDIWIAAHAMEHGVDLCSFDNHFEHVNGLVWVKPAG